MRFSRSPEYWRVQAGPSATPSTSTRQFTASSGVNKRICSTCASEVKPTFEKFTAGQEVTGIPKLKTLIDERVVKTALQWLSIDGRSASAEADWRVSLIVNKEGNPRPLLANAIAALRGHKAWSGVLAFNDLDVAVETTAVTPFGKPANEKWTDNDTRSTCNWLQHQGILVNTNIAGEAVLTVAFDRRFHPIRQYLESLTWDGKPRLDSWTKTYLGSTVPIAETFGRMWLISAVARAMTKEGAKVDHCLVLEGPQGIFKSTTLRVLASDTWFTDQLSEVGCKDSKMECHGPWIIELAELEGLNKSESSRIKAFISTQCDRFRLPYGKNTTSWPRNCVFAGTVNHEAYLRDETGARRFWPIRCGRIDIDALARDRDQLWAEAMTRFMDGANWWPDDEETIEAAEREQSERYQEGQWDALISAWLENPVPKPYLSVPLTSTAESVTTDDILHHCIGKEHNTWTRGDQMAVAAALQSLGWCRFQQTDGDKRQWRYRPGRLGRAK